MHIITRYSRVKSKNEEESILNKSLYFYYLLVILIIPSPLSLIYYKLANKAKVIKIIIY